MTEEEFKQKKVVLEQLHRQQLDLLIRTCALSNNPYKIGDVVTDHHQTIKIDKIRTATIDGFPTCVYDGIALKKDLTPKKDNSRGQVWQINIGKRT